MWEGAFRRDEDLRRDLVLAVERSRVAEQRQADLEQRIHDDYVTKEEFAPIKKFIYAVVGVLLIGISGLVVKLIIYDTSTSIVAQMLTQ